MSSEQSCGSSALNPAETGPELISSVSETADLTSDDLSPQQSQGFIQNTNVI